jgi:hypothetical protein
MSPYPDLIDTTTADGQQLKTGLDRYRKSLSRSAAPEHLFATRNEQGLWVDLDKLPEQADVYKKVLSLTKTRNLAEARKAFRNPLADEARIEVLMANADSIALLISEMGRQLDPPTAPIPLPAPTSSQADSVQASP